MNTPQTTQELFTAVTTPTLRRWVDGFLLAKRAEGVGAGTLRKTYAPRLAHFVAYCEAHHVAMLEGIDASLMALSIIGSLSHCFSNSKSAESLSP